MWSQCSVIGAGAGHGKGALRPDTHCIHITRFVTVYRNYHYAPHVRRSSLTLHYSKFHFYCRAVEDLRKRVAYGNVDDDHDAIGDTQVELN